MCFLVAELKECPPVNSPESLLNDKSRFENDPACRPAGIVPAMFLREESIYRYNKTQMSNQVILPDMWL